MFCYKNCLGFTGTTSRGGSCTRATSTSCRSCTWRRTAGPRRPSRCSCTPASWTGAPGCCTQTSSSPHSRQDSAFVGHYGPIIVNWSSSNCLLGDSHSLNAHSVDEGVYQRVYQSTSNFYTPLNANWHFNMVPKQHILLTIHAARGSTFQSLLLSCAVKASKLY